ncbi:hypothetical protein ACFL01_03825 [Planctomycetota bacterium]
MSRNRAVCAILAVALGAGCTMPREIPTLVQRTVLAIEAIIVTEPEGAIVYGDDLASMGKAPVAKRWEIEKLTWSDGTIHFRMLPKGIGIRQGDELTLEVTAKTDGYAEESATIRIPFAGEERTVTKKLVLRKAGGNAP